MRKHTLIFGITLLLLFTAAYFVNRSTSTINRDNLIAQEALAEEQGRKVIVTIEDGDTFGVITEELGIPYETVSTIIASSTPVYDLTSIRAGKEMAFYFDRDTDVLNTIIYEPNTEEIVTVFREKNNWTAERVPIEYEIRRKSVQGIIESSLYESALEQGLDERVIIDLAEVFAWQIDFAVEIRTGDTFAMTFEERYRDDKYIMPGTILATKFNNDGTEYKGYYYKEGEENDGYFDPEGNSLQKIFLRSPLQYRYISSGFTGARRDPITRNITSHYAIDYVANYGTPAVSVGEGTVLHAGWDGGYGYSVDVRHNEMYTTKYGHFSRLAVSAGQKVDQGQIVGYVGSTGHSTGNHLHYELHKFGTPVNPFTIELPSDEALVPESIPAFQEFIKQFDL